MQDLAAHLGLTRNAVRAHLAGLEREGLVRRGGSQTGVRKPHTVYTLTESAAHVFPNAYGLVLRQLVSVLMTRLRPQSATAYLRQLGRQLASKASQEAREKSPRERRRIAVGVLNSLGGDAALSTKDGREFIEGRSCPLSAVTADHPEACVIAQTALAEIIGKPVAELCLHGAKPRCRFQIAP